MLELMDVLNMSVNKSTIAVTFADCFRMLTQMPSMPEAENWGGFLLPSQCRHT